MNKSFFIAWVVALIVWMGGDFAVHGAWLASTYLANAALYRPEADQAQYLPWMIGAHVICSAAAAWIYGRGVQPSMAWLGQGLRFGLALAVLMVPQYMVYYSVQPLPLDLVMKQMGGETGVMLLVGLAMGFTYKLTDKRA
jgi:hypothetical protein